MDQKSDHKSKSYLTQTIESKTNIYKCKKNIDEKVGIYSDQKSNIVVIKCFDVSDKSKFEREIYLCEQIFLTHSSCNTLNKDNSISNTTSDPKCVCSCFYFLHKLLWSDSNTIDSNNSTNSNNSSTNISDINVSQIIEVFQTDNNNIYVVMKYSGNDLFDFVQHNVFIDEPKAKIIFRKIINNLIFLHSIGIAHCDLSLENICLDVANIFDVNDETNVTIIDYGMALVHPQSKLYLQKYSSTYFTIDNDNKNINELSCDIKNKSVISGRNKLMSPERLISKQMKYNYCAYKDDVYSLGVILFSMLFGHYPFADPKPYMFSKKTISSIIDQFSVSHLKLHPKNIISSDALNLIKNILSYDIDRY